MKFICVSGHAQNGKDTTAKMISDCLNVKGHKPLIVHYADLVKFICKMYFNWDGEKDEYGRSLLQKVGTDIVRAKDPDFWVRSITTILSFFPGYWDYVIVPDTRFPNEITFLVDSHFSVYHVRVSRENFDSPLTETQKKHPSETALDNVEPDFMIINSGSLEDLSAKVGEVVDSILKDEEIS